MKSKLSKACDVYVRDVQNNQTFMGGTSLSAAGLVNAFRLLQAGIDRRDNLIKQWEEYGESTQEYIKQLEANQK